MNDQIRLYSLSLQKEFVKKQVYLNFFSQSNYQFKKRNKISQERTSIDSLISFLNKEKKKKQEIQVKAPMSYNVNRPKSLVPIKNKQSTPLVQYCQSNAKKRDSLKSREEEDNIVRSNDLQRLKSHRNQQGQLSIQYHQQTQQSHNQYTPLSNNAAGMIYFDGNLIGNNSLSNKRIKTASGVKNQHSKDHSDLNFDEFSDLKLVQKKIMLNIDDMYIDKQNNNNTNINTNINNNDNMNDNNDNQTKKNTGITKKLKYTLNLKSLPNQVNSMQQNAPPQISILTSQNGINQKNRIGNNQTTNSKVIQPNTNGDKIISMKDKQMCMKDKYISIKETITAFKEVEQRLVKKNNEFNSASHPLQIQSNQQIPISSTEKSYQQQDQQQLKQVYSDDRLLNVVRSTYQQINESNYNNNNNDDNEKKQINVNSSINRQIQQNTTSNKENNTTSAANSSKTPNGSGASVIFNYLADSSATAAAATTTANTNTRLNNLNVFRIKKQQQQQLQIQSNRNSFILFNPPSSQTYISQIDLPENTKSSKISNGLYALNDVQQNYSDNNQVEDDSLSIDGNLTQITNISGTITNNCPASSSNINLNKKKRNSKTNSIYTPFTPNSFRKQESAQIERNSSNNISTNNNRYIQKNRQIVSAQRPPKSGNKNTHPNLTINNTYSTNQLRDQDKGMMMMMIHQKRHSEKLSPQCLDNQSHWSPAASIYQSDDIIGIDQLPIKTNRSQSTNSRANKYHNHVQKENNQPTISTLSLKQNKSEYHPEVLQMLNSSEIKPLYWKQSTIDGIIANDSDRNVLIIKGDNLLFGGITSQTFWEKKDSLGGGINSMNGINFNPYLGSHVITPTGDMYGSKLNEIKRIFKTLSKHYLIFLLFNSCSKKVKDLVNYMIKTNFTLDGAYYMHSPQTNNNTFSNKCVNLQQIIIDFKLNNVNKVIILDAVPSNFQVNLNLNPKLNQFRTPMNSAAQKKKQFTFQSSMTKSGILNTESEPYLLGQTIQNEDEGMSKNTNYKLKREQHFDILHEFIPKFEDQIMKKTKIVLFKQRINPNLLQANQKKVLEVALSFVESRAKQFSSNMQFVNLDISDVTAKAYHQGQINHRKKNFLKQINKIKQSNKSTKETIDQDGDKMAENFRNRLIEYMKSTQKSIHNLYYLVGDLVVRNRNIFQKYYSDSFHCKKRNVDNLLQLDILRYKPFPSLAKQKFLRGKQASEYDNLIKQLPQQNPYDILFSQEDNISNNNDNSESILNSNPTINNIDDEDDQAIKNQEEDKQEKKNRLSYFLPINVYLCLEQSI